MYLVATHMRLGIALCFCAILIVCSFGCDSNSTGSDPCTDCPPVVDPSLARADSMLSSVMDVAINQTIENADSSFRPRDIDFTTVNAAYKSVLAGNPNSTHAQFGVAFTNLLVFLADPELNDLYDRFKTLADTLQFRPVYLAPVFSLGGDIRPGVPLTTGGIPNILTDPSKYQSRILLAAAADPNVSDIQYVIETKLMPIVDEAILLLDKVIATEGYVFLISPAMQANPGADYIELDRPDFRVFRASLLAAKAGLHIFLARDLDIETYDVAGVNAAMDRNTSFGGLRSGGIEHMASSKVALLASAAEVQLALTDLIAEITGDPDQTNDLIAVYPGDLADLNEIKTDLATYQDYFNGVRTVEIIFDSWYDCYWNGQNNVCTLVEDTFSIVADVSKFFDNPIDNPKQLLPNYTITLEELSDVHLATINSHFSRTRYWDALIELFGTADSMQIVDSMIWYNGQYYDLPPNGTQAFYEAVADYGSGQQFVLGWDDAYLFCYGTDVKEMWCYHSSLKWRYQEAWDHPDQVAACFFWEATTYENWTVPNPTLNGLFPNRTSLDWKEEIWNSPNDWSRGDCDTTYIEF